MVRINDDSHQKEARAIEILKTHVQSGILSKTFEACRADLSFHLNEPVEVAERLGIQVKSALATKRNDRSWQFTYTKGYEGLLIICVPLKTDDEGEFVLANTSVLVIPGDDVKVDTVTWTINRTYKIEDKWGPYSINISVLDEHLCSMYHDEHIKKHIWDTLTMPTQQGRIIEFDNYTKRKSAFNALAYTDDPLGECTQIDVIINGIPVQDKSAYSGKIGIRLTVNCRKSMGAKKSRPYSLNDNFVAINVFHGESIGVVSTAALVKAGVIRRSDDDRGGKVKFSVLPPSTKSRISKYSADMVQWFKLIPENTQSFLDTLQQCKIKHDELMKAT